MIAEVHLYWNIYLNVCEVQVDLKQMNLALRSWQHEWAALFSKKLLKTCLLRRRYHAD